MFFKKNLLLSLYFVYAGLFASQPVNTYQDLIDRGLICEGSHPSLHLGCGESHLSDCINIDFPMENRPLHSTMSADYYFDITQLCFPPSVIKKIENHHVFEHFSRPTALALLCAWHHWLEKDGCLIIETPDFDHGIQRYLRSRSFSEKQAILRHLFGSHEEPWAVHWDGWSKDKFTYVLEALGFQIHDIHIFSWQCTDNITVKATKKNRYSVEELSRIAKNILKLSKIDNSTSEIQMWEKWCNDFDKAIELMIL